MPITLWEYNKKYSACHWASRQEILDALFSGAWIEDEGAYDENFYQYRLCFIDGESRLVTVSNVDAEHLDQFVQTRS